MRYTRVDLKGKKNEVLLFSGTITIIFIVAFFLGTTLFNFFIKESVITENVSNTSKTSESSDSKSTNSTSTTSNSFVMLQCGVFSVKDNAQKVFNTLNTLGSPVMVEEDGKFKIYFGLYENGEEAQDMELLKNNNIQVSKISLKTSEDSLCNEEIIETSRASIKVLNKLNEKNVTSINISELKSWINELKAIDEKDKNYNVFQELKQYILSLPDSLTKEKATEFETKIINTMKLLGSS